MSIDQARMAFLALSLAQITDQQHKLSLEMATIRGMRRELAALAEENMSSTNVLPCSRYEQLWHSLCSGQNVQ